MRDINPEVGMSVMVRVVVGPDVTGIWAGANHRGMVLLVPQGKTYIPWEKVVGLRWWVEAPPPETEPAPETDGRDYEREARELSVRLTQALNRGSRLQEYAADLRLWVRANRGTGKTTDDILDTVADIAGKIEHRLQEGVELEPALQTTRSSGGGRCQRSWPPTRASFPSGPARASRKRRPRPTAPSRTKSPRASSAKSGRTATWAKIVCRGRRTSEWTSTNRGK